MHSRDYRFCGTPMRAPGKNENQPGSAFDVPWTDDAIGALFPAVVAESKDTGLTLWSASTYRAGETRGKDAIEVLHAVVADADCADVGSLEQTTEHLRRSGYAFAIYTSFSHRSRTKLHETGVAGPFDCYRVILPCDHSVRSEDYAALVAAVHRERILPPDPQRYALEAAGKLVALGNGRTRPAKARGWDATGAEYWRHWYVPGCPAATAGEASLEVFQGRCLNVAKLVALGCAPQTVRGVHADERPSDGARVQFAKVAAALKARGFCLDGDNPQHENRGTCPYCHDASPSLCVRATGERVVLTCFAGCTTDQILGAIGLKRGDLFSAISRAAYKEERLAALPSSGLDLPDVPFRRLPGPPRAAHSGHDVASLRELAARSTSPSPRRDLP